MRAKHKHISGTNSAIESDFALLLPLEVLPHQYCSIKCLRCARLLANQRTVQQLMGNFLNNVMLRMQRAAEEQIMLLISPIQQVLFCMRAARQAVRGVQSLMENLSNCTTRAADAVLCPVNLGAGARCSPRLRVLNVILSSSAPTRCRTQKQETYMLLFSGLRSISLL